MTRKVYLEVVGPLHPQASIIQARKMPAIIGDDPSTSLACGGCKQVIGKHVSAEAVAARYRAPHQLVFRCPECRANNFIPGAVNH